MSHTYLLLPDGKERFIPDLPAPLSFEETRRIRAHKAPEALRSYEGFFPCLNDECAGSGWIYDPNDRPCPVEGNKMRDRIQCPTCKGKGGGTREDLFDLHRKAVDEYSSLAIERKTDIELAQSGLKKLTSDEWKAICKLIKI